jgi:putative ABC transport system permease protein
VKFKFLVRIALSALVRHKLRTGLAMFGIAIGVGAVVSMVAIGEGASARVRAAIDSLGKNMIWLEEGAVSRSGVRLGGRSGAHLTLEDARAIRDQIDLVSNVSPHVDTRVQLVSSSQNWFSMVRGVPPEYLAVRDWKIHLGTMYSTEDVNAAANVCVLGQTVCDRLFGTADPIDEMIRVKNLPCRVVGVLTPKGMSATNQDQDDTLLMPFTTVMKKLAGQTFLDDIMCTAVSSTAVAEAERQITDLLRERHHIGDGQLDDFNLRHPTEIATVIAASTRNMEIMLASIAAIALLLGGVGIMNIMLVSVTERTHEIGIRMALGAREADIQKQFLLEAVLLSLCGGLVGIVLGSFASLVINQTLQWRVLVSPIALLLSCAFAMLTGIFFGFYPAFKASRLHPIEALHFEA